MNHIEGVGGITPLILNIGSSLGRGVSGQFYTQAAVSLEKEPPVSMEYEAGWAPEQIQTSWRSE